MTDDLKAFRSADFGWTRQLRSVWRDPPYHVSAIHADVADDIIDDFERKTSIDYTGDEPLGRVIVGPAGFGKTHLIGELRRRVWKMGGWFILLDLVGVKDFWASAALGFLNSLQVRTATNGQTQYQRLISLLGERLGIERQAAAIVSRHRGSPPELVKSLATLYVVSLSKRYYEETSAHRDVVTALILLISEDLDCHSIAHAWLQGMPLDADLVRPFGIASQCDPIKVVDGLSWVMSLVGPTLIAVDQIDAILSASNAQAHAVVADGEFDETQSIVESMSLGLMNLHERKHRAVTVISCLEATWNILKSRASAAVTDRYSEMPTILRSLPGGQLARELVAARLKQAYQSLGFVPRCPTWPFAEAAFENVGGYSPRQLLKACEAHRLRCVADGQVSECGQFESGAVVQSAVPMGDINKAFAAAYANADLRPLAGEAGKMALSDLFCDTLGLFQRQLELPDDIDAVVQRDPDQHRPSLHGRLSFTFHSQGDREQHYCFRLLNKTSPIAFQSRLKAAMTASGITNALKFRHLIILRHNTLPNGPKTKILIDQFVAAGGKFVAPTDDELRTFVALNAVAHTRPDGFDSWLRAQKPLFHSGIFQAAGLCPPEFLKGDTPTHAVRAPKPEIPKLPSERKQPKPAIKLATYCPTPADELPIGHRFVDGKPRDAVTLATNLLPSHMAIIAGSGSGKTVFLRRVIEEAALRGIPSIVLDVNNDLSRLGDPWPERPKAFDNADAAASDAYHRQTDVVVWTPGVNSGNPIALNLLPDFGAIADGNDSLDERTQAIDMAVATLTPFLSLGGQKKQLKQGVLAATLEKFSEHNKGTLEDLIALLAELPSDVSDIDDANKLANAMANQLRAARSTNPLLRSDVASLDPQRLFYGPSGNTRISVINLSGLGSDEAKQAFVNQLQMTLFTWIKQHPSPTGRLYVLDEAQNFVPSSRAVASLASASALTAQARKYGLGMIFATQHPKGIANGIISNCTTSLYGRMNAPNTIQAVEELIAAKGGHVNNIGKLTTGEFYFATAKYDRPVLIHTPLCLSWHPQNPPTADEIVRKACACRQTMKSAEEHRERSSVVTAE